jgi:hypothetical protein
MNTNLREPRESPTTRSVGKRQKRRITTRTRDDVRVELGTVWRVEVVNGVDRRERPKGGPDVGYSGLVTCGDRHKYVDNYGLTISSGSRTDLLDFRRADSDTKQN